MNTVDFSRDGTLLAAHPKNRFAISHLLVGLLAGLFLAPLTFAGQVTLKSRGAVVVSVATTNEFFDALQTHPGLALHGLVMFSQHPGASQRARLRKAGIHVLTPVQGTAYRVRVAKDASRVYTTDNLTPQFLLLVPEDRVEPELWAAADVSVDVTVRFHVGVPENDAVALLKTFTAGSNATLVKQSDETWLVDGFPGERVHALAQADAVQWINRSPSVSSELDRTRPAINVDLVQQFDPTTARFSGLSGRAVRVGVFELGIDERHPDLSGRVVRNDAGIDAHATHMAGIIAGTGLWSDRPDSCGRSNGATPYRWMGIAPRAELLDIPRLPPFGRNGANATVHLHYIKRWKMEVSNHSYGFNSDGTYDNTNVTRDQIIRGDATASMRRVPPRLHVTSAGNKGLYFALSKQLKNALVVGNWSLIDKTVHDSASRGPTSDGRIKPDVVAPGDEVTAPFICRDLPNDCGVFPRDGDSPLCPDEQQVIERRNYYFWGVGTSGAAAVATGTVAIVLEQYRLTYGLNGRRPIPLPSTLRGIMIHSAGAVTEPTRRGTTEPVSHRTPQAPSYTTGWGLIDARAAVDVVKTRRIREGSIPQTCSWLTYAFDVPRSAAGSPRVTLTWDDVAGDPALADDAPKLVNDLDLILIDPNGHVHYPWRLDQSISDADGNALPDDWQECGTAIAVRRQFKRPVATGIDPPRADRGRDHLNNVEVVDAPAVAGRWYAHIIGFNIAERPQRFSLIGERFVPVDREQNLSPRYRTR